VVDRGPAYSDMLSLNFSRPLQLRQRDRQSRVLAAALATAAQVHAEREEETREHTAETQALVTTWSSHHERLRRYSDLLIPLARDRTSASLTAYRSGGGTLSEVLDARAAEIETRLAQLDLEMATADLWAKLHYLIPADAAHP
jgi:outer membrane protein TolC